jgi:hypothetical protein
MERRLGTLCLYRGETVYTPPEAVDKASVML